MKPDIHPNYEECKITCACGNAFTTHSTVGSLHVDICSACHPFFTGKHKFVDTAGRVEKFQKKFYRRCILQQVQACGGHPRCSRQGLATRLPTAVVLRCGFSMRR